MNRCIYQIAHGVQPNCKGNCKMGDKKCEYYFVDEVWSIINEWKKEAGVSEPVIWRKDYKRNKVCMYTTKPGLFIGYHGDRYKKYHEKIKNAIGADELFKNGIDFIECDDFIDGE